MFLVLGTITLSLLGTPEKSSDEKPMTQGLPPEAQKKASLHTFLAAGAGLCFAGTYAALYLKARRSATPLSHSKITIDALGYTGAGFSITAASYFASILWSKSGLFQDKS